MMADNSHSERKDIVTKVFKGAGFRFGALLSLRALTFLRLMVFARLFMPEEIGTVALAVTCIGIVSVLGDFGFYQSVIRAKKDSLDIADTAFTMSLIIASGLMGLTFVGAPVFSNIFSANLDRYLHFLAFMVLSIPLNFPVAFWEKELKFFQASLPPLISELWGFLITILIEIQFHSGIWSLLIGHIAGFVCSSLYIWTFADRRPHLNLDIKNARKLLGFGTPFMIQNLNGMVMHKGDNLIVAGIWGLEQNAYYNFAWQLPLIVSALSSTLDGVLFPVYARLNERRETSRYCLI